ncbi:hypothetical protein PLESTF_000330800 [Pleodorina starrii]|nr:hypothetical protein PLESTF_000330800 [Pleodorina starrii]
MAQLLDLLRQYPGGLAEPALMTEILSRRIRKQGKPDCADAGVWDGGGGDALSGRAAAVAAAASNAGTQMMPSAGGPAGGCSNSGDGGGQRPTRHHPLPSSPVVVAAVAYVECLSPPHGSGPPFETAGGSWLLHLEEGGPAVAGAAAAGGCGASLGSMGSAPGVGGVGGGAAVPMYLHSELRLLVMGRTPLVAAGRRVRIASVPPRSATAAASPLAERLLPGRYVVPELPAALVAPGCWPHFDALRYGGTEPMMLGQASSGALANVAAGSRAGVNGWVMARVAGVGAAPPREPGAFDRHRRRLVQLVDPAAPSGGGSGGGAAAATLVLYGDAVPLGDLLLPGEVIAMYQPTVFVHDPAAPPPVPPAAAAAAAAAAAQREPLTYEHGPDTVLAVLPPGWASAPPSSQPLPPPLPAAVVAPMDVDGATAAAAAAARPPPAITSSSSSQRWGSHSQAASQEPRHALLGLGSIGQQGAGASQASAGGGSGGGAGVVDGRGAAAAAVGAGANCTTVAGADGGTCRTVVVARVQALLGYSHGAGTSHGGRLRALLSDGTGAVAVEMQLARGSKVLSHMREGHVVMLLGAVPLPAAASAAAAGLAASAAAALLGHIPPRAAGASAIPSARPPQPQSQPQSQPQPQVQVLFWSEAALGSEAHSLTAMPAQVTTPPLVSYTCLAALRLALRNHAPQRLMQQQRWRQQQSSSGQEHGPPAVGHRRLQGCDPNQTNSQQHRQPFSQQQQQQQQQWPHLQQQLQRQSAPPPSLPWPADALHALAEATRQLPDPRRVWGRDVPYIQRPFRLGEPDGEAPEPAAARPDSGGAGGDGLGPALSSAAAAAAAGGPALGGHRRSPAAAPGAGAGGAGGAAAAPVGELAAAAECGPDGWCGALACVAVVRSAQVATQRVHRHCGRPVSRAASMFLDLMDFDDMDEEGSGGGGGATGAGAGAAAAGGPGAGGGAGLAAPADGPQASSHPAQQQQQQQQQQDTPSKDQSMDGLWECAFCGLDLVKDDLQWHYTGSLTLEDVSVAAPSAAATAAPGPQRHGAAAASAAAAAGACGGGGGCAAAGAVTLPADPEALHSLLGVSAAAFHSLGTARRRRFVESCLVDRRGVTRRCVVAIYPKPWRPPGGQQRQRQQPGEGGPVAVLSFDGCGGGGAGGGGGGPGLPGASSSSGPEGGWSSSASASASSSSTCCCAQLGDCWAVAQLHHVE